jgi:mRNA interferase MazF
MRPIHVAQLDETRPVLVLTRESAPSVVSCDNVTTIAADALREQIGVLLDDQESQLSAAIRAAFDL